MSRIAIFGGTFNPVHNGHINLCLECNRYFNFDKILLVPDNIPSHKSADDLVSNEHRFNMLSIATRDEKLFKVCDIEYKLKGKSYTVNTISELKKIYPTDELFLIIGSDMLFMFEQWYAFKEILKSVTLVVGARQQDEYDAMLRHIGKFGKLSRNIEVVRINVVDISSSDIRKKIKNGDDVSEYLNDGVLAYISKNKLYKK